MLSTTQDILYIVISFCVLWLTVFLCWMFYYATQVLKNANQVVEEFRMRLQSLTDAINYVRGKVEHMSGLMSLATGGVTGLVKHVVTKKAKSWINAGTDELNDAAKAAVEKAVNVTAKKIKKAAAKVRR